MKKILLVGLISLGTANISSAKDFLKGEALCDFYSGYAEQTMIERQGGGVANKEISRLNTLTISDPMVKRYLKKLVMDAYEIPRFETKQMQNKAVIDFKNQVYVKCFRVIDQN